MGYEVITLDENWSEQFDSFCAKNPAHMIYSTWRYRNFLMKLLGCRAMYLGALNEKKLLKGVMPLLVFDGPLGTVINSLPFFGSYGGIFSEHNDASLAIWATFDQIISSSGVASATVIMNPFLDQNANFSWTYQDIRVGQVTSLDFNGAEPKTALMSILDSSARRNIRSAAKAKVLVTVENDSLQELQSIHEENILAIGGRVKSSEFFKLIPEYFEAGKDYKIYVARIDGEIVSSMLLFYAGSTVDYYMPGTRLAFRSKQPSAAILFRAMLDANSEGYKYWNWGGTWTDQEGVLKFKRKWGAIDLPYKYFTFLKNQSIIDCTPDALLEMYGNFYLIPFKELKRIEGCINES